MFACVRARAREDWEREQAGRRKETGGAHLVRRDAQQLRRGLEPERRAELEPNRGQRLRWRPTHSERPRHPSCRRPSHAPRLSLPPPLAALRFCSRPAESGSSSGPGCSPVRRRLSLMPGGVLPCCRAPSLPAAGVLVRRRLRCLPRIAGTGGARRCVDHPLDAPRARGASPYTVPRPPGWARRSNRNSLENDEQTGETPINE